MTSPGVHGANGTDSTAGLAAAIFDVDGVLVDSPHENAWRDALADLMNGPWRDIRDRTGWTPDAFTPEVYGRLISGRPRASGARAGLEWFGIPPTDENVALYAARKQALIVRLIEAGRFTAFPDALRFALALKGSGVMLAEASSSRNADSMLERIRVDVFAEEQGLSYDFIRPGMTLRAAMDADVSGRRLAHGKPHPDIFLAAADALGIAPARCVVVEDAVAGIQAARAGGMAALAIARAGDQATLAQAGADLVVTSLDDVDVAALTRGRLQRRRAGEEHGPRADAAPAAGEPGGSGGSPVPEP